MAGKFDATYGQNREPHQSTDYAAKWFMIDQLIKRMNTATLVKVESVTVDGQVGPVGQLDVTPLVNMVDGAATNFPHGKVRKIHYSRMQGGSKAIILDPKPGDIGIAVFADRDTSLVRKNKKASPPGSRRRFDVADGVYVMTVLGSQPTSYIDFESDGTITLSPDNGTTFVKIAAGRVEIKSAKVVLNGVTYLGGDEAAATRAVSAIGTIDTGGFAEISDLLTKVLGL